MADIYKLEKDGKTIWPATTTTAIVDPDTRVVLNDSIETWNLTKIWPSEDIKAIDTAVTFIASKLPESRQTNGVKIEFVNASGENEAWEFVGGDGIAFNNLAGWRRIGGSLMVDLLNKVFPINTNFTSSHLLLPINVPTDVTFSWDIEQAGVNISDNCTYKLNGEVVLDKEKIVTLSPLEKTTFEYNLSVDYRGNIKEDTIKILAIEPTYWGTVIPGAELDVDTVTTLTNKTLQGTKEAEIGEISYVNKRFVYAYPASLGELKSVKDENGLEYLVGGGFVKSTLVINAVNYNIYSMPSPSTVTNFKYIFS